MSKKPNKIKQNFWLVTVFFSILVIAGLLILWGSPRPMNNESSMMSGTMGTMARQETGAFTLAELFKNAEYMKSDMSAHHQNSSLLAKIHIATTSVIVALLPFVIAGTIFLIVLWI